MQDFAFAREVFEEDFLYERHVNYLLKSLKKSPLDVAEAHRLSSLFFVVSGLDLLGALNTRLNRSDKQNIIEWIYSYQVNVDKVIIPPDLLEDRNFRSEETKNSRQREQNQESASETKSHPNRENNASPTNEPQQQSPPRTALRFAHAGFRATSTINNDVPFDCGVLPMTYCALVTLIILGDDLRRVDRKSIIAGMRQLQLADGSFKPSVLGGESDMRLVYCACAVSQILDDWSGLDKGECVKFVRNSLSYEGAFAQCPGSEAHGGSTYCALASLLLMSKLEETLSKEEIDRLIRWCMNRLDSGFSGRPNKDQDTCYSFWIGACLVMLGHFKFVEQKNLLDFILTAQEERGGLSKVPDFYSDPLHTYLGFAGLSFIDEDLCAKRRINLLKLDPMLNISMRARSHLETLFARQKTDRCRSSSPIRSG